MFPARDARGFRSWRGPWDGFPAGPPETEKPWARGERAVSLRKADASRNRARNPRTPLAPFRLLAWRIIVRLEPSREPAHEVLGARQEFQRVSIRARRDARELEFRLDHFSRDSAGPIRNRRAPRCRRNGRGLPGQGPAVGPRGRDQGVAGLPGKGS